MQMERNGYAMSYEWLKTLIYRGPSRKIFNSSYMHIRLSRYTNIQVKKDGNQVRYSEVAVVIFLYIGRTY